MSITTLAILVLLIQIFFARFRYRYGLMLFIFIWLVFPVEIVISDAGYLNITRISMFIQILFLFLRNSKTHDNDAGLKKFPLWVPVIIFSLFLLPSYLFSTFSTGFPRGLWTYFYYFFLDYFFIGIVIYFSINSYNELQTIFTGILLAVIVMGIYGLYEYFSGYLNPFWDAIQNEFKLKIVYDYQDDLRYGFANRIKSTNVHPIVYGGKLACLLPVFLIFVIQKEKLKLIKINRRLIGIAFILLLSNAFLTVSRSCWFQCGITVSIIFWLERKYILSKSIIFKFLAALIIPVLLILIPVVFTKVTDSNVNGSSFQLRIDQYTYIFNAIVAKDFFIGFGPSAVQNFLESGIHPDAFGFESIIFEVFVNNGLLGFIGYVILYFYLFKYVRKNGLKIARPYIIALFVAHIVFVITTGERQTFSTFWLAYWVLVKIDEFYSAGKTKYINKFLK